MNEFELKIRIISKNFDELDVTERRLVDEARRMTQNSYAPYSHFRVGAAILLDNGAVATGANQENAAFPSGTCAERSACYWAGANYPGAAFEMIAITAVAPDGTVPLEPTAPCGACRQALLEYEKLAGHDVKVLLAGRDTVYIVPSVKALLPLAFNEF